jgi:hypothetical protein
MHLTQMMSKENRFRFFNEGFARLFEYSENPSWYFNTTMKVGKEYLKKGKVSFSQIEDWITYWGDPEVGNLDPNAYNIGSTFVYFLINTYGKNCFRKFLVVIGKTQNLNLALSQTYQLSRKKAQRRWRKYIQNHK